jgi:hypothetical protein
MVCWTPYRIELHHIFYARRWLDTKPDHLIPLCHKHHGIIDHLGDRGIAKTEGEIDAVRTRIIKRGGSISLFRQIKPWKTRPWEDVWRRYDAERIRQREFDEAWEAGEIPANYR